MKNFKKLTTLFALVLFFIFAFTFAGCASSGREGSYGGGSYGDSSSGGWLYPSGPETGDESGEGESGADGSSHVPFVKQLTAAEWRDAYNYDFWLNLFEKDITTENQETRDGIFSGFAKAKRGLDTFNMHQVYVSCGETPVAGAQVLLYDESNVKYSAVTDSAGMAYVFGNGTNIKAISGQFSASAEVSQEVTTITLTDSAACENELEIMFVVDTTGSMSDELSFLCDELAGIVSRVSSAVDCNIRLGLVFYRDEGDEYVTKKFDFTEVNSTQGLNSVVQNIKAQDANGGGDTPEAVETALTEAVAADWNTNSKTKLLFHVLDAPYHDGQENQSTFANSVKQAAEKGIRIIPVAASGLDTLGQYIMRCAALLTGGTYTFLTDDSGIGNSHTLPDVGEFTVEYLSDLMVRLIKGYYTGTFEEPVLWTQSKN